MTWARFSDDFEQKAVTDVGNDALLAYMLLMIHSGGRDSDGVVSKARLRKTVIGREMRSDPDQVLEELIGIGAVEIVGADDLLLVHWGDHLMAADDVTALRSKKEYGSWLNRNGFQYNGKPFDNASGDKARAYLEAGHAAPRPWASIAQADEDRRAFQNVPDRSRSAGGTRVLPVSVPDPEPVPEPEPGRKGGEGLGDREGVPARPGTDHSPSLRSGSGGSGSPARRGMKPAGVKSKLTIIEDGQIVETREF